MNLKYTIFTITVLLLLGCGTSPRQTGETEEQTDRAFNSQIHEAFMLNMKELCGNSFLGRQVYRSHHGESWADRLMIMHVEDCGDFHIHIPFHVNDDHSRTWMFFEEDGQLVFRHQHLYEDGTHEDDSMYGGFADDNGNSFVQYFPADEYTGSVIEGGIGNLWTVSIDPTISEFSYRLDRDGEKRFEIVFDLSTPLSN